MNKPFSTDKFCKDCKMKCTQQYCCVNCTKNCFGRWVCPAFKYESTQENSNAKKKELRAIKKMEQWQLTILN